MVSKYSFNGVIDQDSDPKFVAEGNYLYALNVINVDQSGVKSNMRSTRSVIYALPSGTNNVIGTVEDKQRQTVIIFMENSNDNHRILRYYPLTETVEEVAGGAWLDFSGGRPIHSAEVVDGDLLYWTDAKSGEMDIAGREPRKISLSKAVIAGKRLQYNIFAGQMGQLSFSAGRTYTVSVRDLTGVTVIATATFTASGGDATNPLTGLAWLRAQIVGSAINAFVTLDQQTYNMRASMVNASQTLVISSTDPYIQIAAHNFYKTPFTSTEDHIGTLAKQFPANPPIATYIGDSSVTYNNVKDGCFQFRNRFIFDDDEQSAWSPISMPGLNSSPSGVIQESLNAINVVFTDARLNDPDWLAIITHVEVAVREANDVPFKLLKRIPISEIGTVEQSVRFLNDQTYSVIASDDLSIGAADAQVLGNTQNVPRLAGALCTVADEQGNSRLVLGATLEGYDCPPVDVTVTANDYDNTDLVDIIGTVRVINNSIAAGAEPEFYRFPLNGFVVYLAGTDYFGVSKNKPYSSDNGEFIIRGVPRGIYSMRVASYLCQYGEDDPSDPGTEFPPRRLGSRYNLLNGKEWQKTSSPCIEVAGSIAAHNLRAERLIDLRGFSGATFDLDSEVGFGTIDIQNAHINQETNRFVLAEVYLHDNEGVWNELTRRASSLSVENIVVNFYRYKYNAGGSTPVGYEMPAYATKVTDHNGYAYQLVDIATGGGAYDGVRFVVQDWDENVGIEDPINRSFFGTWNDVLSEQAFERTPVDRGPFNTPNYIETSISDQNGNGVFESHLFCGFPDWYKAHRTTIQGRVVDADAVGLGGVLVFQMTNGRWEITNQNGQFSFALHDYDGGSQLSGVQDLYVTYEPDSAGAFPPVPLGYSGSDLFDPDADGTTNPIVVEPAFVFPFVGGIVSNQRFVKAGGIYKTGIVYEDDFGRSCGVIPTTVVRVPFHTDLGTYVPKQMQFSIKNRPPVWATRYRIVRTKNTFHYAYNHIPVGEVLYANIPFAANQPNIVTYSSGEATHIMLRIETKLIPDKVTFPLLLMFRDNAQNGYRAKFGDRVRYLLDEAAVPVFTGSTLEVKVEGEYIDGEKYYVVIPYSEIIREVKPGWMFEFFTPKTFPEEIYYETGVSLPILNPGTNTRVHKGITQDQTLIGGLPATGPILSGDAFWRLHKFELAGGNGLFFITESQKASEQDDIIWEDIGRPVLYDPSAKEIFYYNRFRVSGLYVPNSAINSLSAFGALDFQSLNRKYGPIKWQGMVHNVMFCVCAFKSQPVYVGKGRLQDLQGGTQIVRSDKIFNIADELVMDSGTNNPESIVVEDGNAYGWDERNGIVWRFGQDGQSSIVRGLTKYFYDRGYERKFLTPATNIVVGGYDRRNDMYILSFRPGNYTLPGDGGTEDVISETLMYSKGKGWSTFFTRVPSCWARVGNQLLFYNAGTGHIMYANNATYNTFASVAGESIIKFAANDMPMTVKDWLNIRLVANKQWQAPEIQILPTGDYPSGMASRLKATRWVKAEGNWWANFLNDMTDPHQKFVDIADADLRAATALLQGRVLKGECAIITLSAVLPAQQNTITAVDVETEASMQTR